MQFCKICTQISTVTVVICETGFKLAVRIAFTWYWYTWIALNKAVIKSIVISPVKVEEGSATFEIFCCCI